MPPKCSYLLGAFATIYLSLASIAAIADEPAAEALPGAASWLRYEPRMPLWVVSRTARCWPFNIWVARTPEQFTRGLMFVRQLHDDGGMLFAMQAEREISMWMRNTFIALDILFADASGKIIKIHENATPLSLEHISSDGLAYAVLELPAGAVAKRNISAGDQLRHAHFGNSGCQTQVKEK
ncbi:MAG: DUF192 domain-containing protein [Gammaproteobacteria bacterium]|nr:DUF192 domain-containing protein [Gammaproteobacteria bacterium]